MKFILSTSGYSYSSKEKLEKLGFIFKEVRGRWHKSDYEPEIEINTLEDLLEFQSEIGCELILDSGSIEIYDDYRE